VSAQSPTNGQTIVYNSTSALWEKNTVSLTAGVNGTLPVANGGTGQTSYTNGQLLIGNTTGNTLTKATLTAGTNVSITNGSGSITINATDQYVGTVTSVAALTLGTTGTDLSSTVANGTTTPVITLNVPTASASNRGALSSTDWSTFNGKQAALVSGSNIKTVNGTSLLGSGDLGTIGVAYGGTGATSLTSGYLLKGNGTSAVSASVVYDSGTNVGIGTTSPSNKLSVVGGTIQQSKTSGDNNAFYGSTSDTSNNYLRLQNTTGILDLTCANGFSYLNSTHNGPMYFGTNGSERMRIASDGSVGIGQSAPNATLHLSGVKGGNGRMSQNSTSAGSATNNLNLIASSSSGGADQWFSYGVSSSNYYFIQNGTSAGSSGLVIDSSNNVSIKSGTPNAPLDVLSGSNQRLLFTERGTGGGVIDCVNAANNAYQLFVLNGSTMAFQTSATERMRILSTGKVLLGTSSDVDGAPFQIDAAAYGNAVYVTRFTNSSTSTSAYNVSRWLQGASGSAIGYVGTGGSTVGTAFFQNRFVVGTQNNTALCFSTNDTFRGMIDGGGQFWWGSQSTIDTVSYAPFQITNALAINTNTTSGTTAVSFFNGQGSGVRVGYIGTSGSSTSYNTSSDQRLKKNIADATDAGAVIDAIQVRQFDWKINDEHQRYGMIAQELDEVFPEAVAHGPTETDMLAVDYSKLVPMIVKELQSLRARVAELEGK
jgi:hypothetical protein